MGFLYDATCCGFLWCSGVLFFLHTAENHFIAVISISKRAVDTADSSGGCTGLFGDFQVGLMLFQHGSNFKTLGKREQLIDCTQIFKKRIAFLFGFQGQDCFKQMINRFRF